MRWPAATPDCKTWLIARHAKFHHRLQLGESLALPMPHATEIDQVGRKYAARSEPAFRPCRAPAALRFAAHASAQEDGSNSADPTASPSSINMPWQLPGGPVLIAILLSRVVRQGHPLLEGRAGGQWLTNIVLQQLSENNTMSNQQPAAVTKAALPHSLHFVLRYCGRP